MPELRRDPVIGRWVIISTDRNRRPIGLTQVNKNYGTVPCPFCNGNEEKTPYEVMAFGAPGRQANKPGWRVRTVPNKFPALGIEGHLHRDGEELYDKMDGFGAHEVIIETPDHSLDLEDLDESQIQEVFWSFRERIWDLKKDSRLEYILVFKNRGADAGASLSHSHSQLIATPMVPMRVKQELRGADEYYEKKGRCIFCDIIASEKQKNIRVVEENEDFIAITPFASRFPFELWVLPKAHESDFEKIQKHQVVRLAQIMKSLLKRLNYVLERPPYNFIIHNSPMRFDGLLYYHWHIELMPKLVRTAGFEWGTGFYINPTQPELAAQYLREA